MKLYSYWRSLLLAGGCASRSSLKGLAYEYVAVHLLQDGGEQHADAYRAHNPHAQVPTLEFEEGGHGAPAHAVARHPRVPRGALPARRRCCRADPLPARARARCSRRS